MPRYLTVIVYCVFGIMLCVFAYGIIFYWDAPISPCGHGFCGKGGRPHTLAEYLDFLRWQKILFITWAIGLPICAAFSAVKKGKWPSQR